MDDGVDSQTHVQISIQQQRFHGTCFVNPNIQPDLRISFIKRRINFWKQSSGSGSIDAKIKFSPFVVGDCPEFIRQVCLNELYILNRSLKCQAVWRQ